MARLATRAHASRAVSAMPLRELDEDAMINVLSNLPAEQLASFSCVSRGSKAVARRDACWRAHLLALCSEYKTKASEEHIAGNDMRIFDAEPAEYDGPPLRMPYLTPWTQAEVKKRDRANYSAAWNSGRSYAWKFPRWRDADGVSECRCYPSSEAKQCPLDRTDVWVKLPYPQSSCCGTPISSYAAFEAHLKCWRHYESVLEDDYSGVVDPTLTDPRMLDGQAAFDALPKFGTIEEVPIVCITTFSTSFTTRIINFC